MNVEIRRRGPLQVLGTVLVAAGLLVGALTLLGDNETTGRYVLAGLLVFTGVGLRIEDALRHRGR